jgi:hypothetical protein
MRLIISCLNWKKKPALSLVFSCCLLTGISFANEIPPASDWSSPVVALRGGPAGSWDAYVTSHGFRMGSIVKTAGIYYLYYTGSNGPRSDNGPADRAIGVATSSDCINFTKYSGNPIITHQPSAGHPNQEEEGAQEPMVALDDNGDFIMYWGAIKAISSSGVDVQVRVSHSTDGFNFTDKGQVTGWDSENWPVGVLHASGGTSNTSGNWHVWVTNHGDYVDLYTGTTPYNLSRVGKVLDCCNKVTAAWPVLHENGRVSLVEVSGSGWIGPDQMKVRETAVDSLDTYSSAVMTFGIPDAQNPCLFADDANGLWRLYWTDISTNERTILSKTAPKQGTTTLEEKKTEIRTDNDVLFQTYPNPANSVANFSFNIVNNHPVSLRLFDSRGKHVSTLINKTFPSGYHSVSWHNNIKSSGVLLAQLKIGNATQTQNITILK